MATFTPLPSGFPIRQSGCEMVDLAWSDNHLEAVFKTDADAFVCVTFEHLVTVRIVDEFIFSVDEAKTGIGADGFAYTVADGAMLANLPDAVKLTYKNLRQYAFISLNSCLEVLSVEPPSFELLEPQG